MHSSSYVQYILNDDIEMGCDFTLCGACAKIGFSLAEHAQKLVSFWLSMCGNWLLVGWACTKMGYSLAEHARKLVTRWLSMRKNWFLVGWACAEIGYSSIRENWLLVGWACAKIGFLLAEHARKLVTRCFHPSVPLKVVGQRTSCPALRQGHRMVDKVQRCETGDKYSTGS